MPRFEPSPPPSRPIPLAPKRRAYPRPWSIEPDHAGFVVLDANSTELFRVGFVSNEMRKEFPHGMTHSEALAFVEWAVPLMEHRVSELEGED